MRITLNVEKRYVYAFVGLLLILVGIVAVNAYNAAGAGGNPGIMGHDASEVGAGYFSGDVYEFSQGLVRLGGWGNSKAGAIEFRGGQTSNDNIIIMKNNGAGTLQISNDGISNYFSLAKTGDVTIKPGAGITLNNQRITDWPTAALPSPRIQDMLWCVGDRCNLGAQCETPNPSNVAGQGSLTSTLYNPPTGCTWNPYLLDDTDSGHFLSEDNDVGTWKTLCILRCS